MFVPASGPCAGFPVYPQNQTPPSLPLTRDPELETEFPTEVAGQTVNDLASGRYIETLCALGNEDSVNAALAAVPAGVDLTDVRVASADVQFGTELVTISAFRLPGHSGDELLSLVGVLSKTVAPSAARFASGLTQTTLGGKSVYSWNDAATGADSYLYPHADTLFIVDGALPSQADQVLAALP
jgi:hypothetical protein